MSEWKRFTWPTDDYWDFHGDEPKIIKPPGLPMKKKMDAPSIDEVTVRAEPAWTSADGRFVIVRAVFPEGLARSLTAKSRSRLTDEYKERVKQIISRHATSEAAYALVPARLVISNGNQFGEIAP